MNIYAEIVKIVILGAAYWAYMAWVSPNISEQLALPVNGVVIPILIGSAGYISFRGHDVQRVVLATAVVFVVILSIAGKGDPAKPGIQLVPIAVMTFFSFIGAISTYGIFYLVRAKKK